MPARKIKEIFQQVAGPEIKDIFQQVAGPKIKEISQQVAGPKISDNCNIFTQIAPYYPPLFWLFRPIISVFLRDFWYISDFSDLFSATFSTFWTNNKCNFDLFSSFFPWKTWKYAIFSSNCALLSATFLIFLTDNKCVFDYCFFTKRGKMLKNTHIIRLKSQKVVDNNKP